MPERGARLLPRLLAVLLSVATVAALVGVVLVATTKRPPPTQRQDARDAPLATTSSVAPKPRKVSAPPAPPAEALEEPDPSKLVGLGSIPLRPWVEEAKKKEEEPKESDPKPLSGGPREELPWDLVEPVPFSDTPTPPREPNGVPIAPEPAAQLVTLPADATLKSWIRANARDVKGTDERRPMHHFEFWLEAPKEIAQKLLEVTYDFNTTAILPPSPASKDAADKFKVRAGGLTCSDKVTVTLMFADGQERALDVDGCELLRAAAPLAISPR